MSRPARMTAAIMGLVVLCALLLALPGRTVTSAYVNDLLIFIDGAHRIAWGQVPSRDFHAALGPLVYYLAAAGYWLAGTFGGAMPTAMALLLIVMSPIFVHVLTSRLRPVLALPYAAYLTLILAAPINIGDGVTWLSFAMFYNRIGWVTLALLLTMYLHPRLARKRQTLFDTLSAILLTLIAIYTKLTYGLVALAFLIFMILDSRQRRWTIQALLLVVLAVLVAEMFWQASLQHMADLSLIASISGGLRLEPLFDATFRNLADIVVLLIAAGIGLACTRNPRDFLFYGFCLSTGILIISNNVQGWGIVTLHVGVAVAAELALRATERPGLQPTVGTPLESRDSVGRRFQLAAALPFLLAALLLPPIVKHAAGLGLHTVLAATNGGRPLGLENFDEIRFTEPWPPGDHGFSSTYVDGFAHGASALAAADVRPERILTLDYVNPFSAGLGLRPPHGDSSWLHWKRNVSFDHHLPADELFADVQIVMVPEIGIGSAPLFEIYGPYISQHFLPVLETDRWTVHLRREHGMASR